MTKNILLTGVGGQGTILASKLLTQGLQAIGYDVKMSEVHGMSQREGPVLTHVRYGEKVWSPVVSRKQGDIIIGFEELEVLRNIGYLRDDGTGVVILNRSQVNPIGVLSGKDSYPQNIDALIQSRAGKLIAINATEEAEKLGNLKVMNIILLGAALKALELDQETDWAQIIADNVRESFVAINQKALALGMSLV